MFEKEISLVTLVTPDSKEEETLNEIMRRSFAHWHPHYLYSDEADFVLDLGNGSALCLQIYEGANEPVLCLGFYLKRLVYSPANREEPAFISDYATQEEHAQAWAEHDRYVVETIIDTALHLTEAEVPMVMSKFGYPRWYLAVRATEGEEDDLDKLPAKIALFHEWSEGTGQSCVNEGKQL